METNLPCVAAVLLLCTYFDLLSVSNLDFSVHVYIIMHKRWKWDHNLKIWYSKLSLFSALHTISLWELLDIMIYFNLQTNQQKYGIATNKQA